MKLPKNKKIYLMLVVALVIGNYFYSAPSISASCSSDCGNETGNGDEIISGPDGPQGSDYDQVFRSLTVHPTDPNTVLMGTERNGFVKSTDGGSTWVRLRQGLRHNGNLYPEIWDIAFDPNNPATIYAATLDSPGPVTGDYPSSIAGVYKSTDGGQTWSRTNCGLTSSRITSVQVDASNSNNVIIGVEGGEATFDELQGQYFNGGIYRSANAGTCWSKIDIDNNDVKNGYWRILSYGAAGNQFLTFAFNYYDMSENVGFLKSTDSGVSWQAFGNSLQSLLIVGFGVSQDGQVIYAVERDSNKIRKSTDGGSNWTTLNNSARGLVVVSPADSQLVLFTGYSSLYRSTDGATFHELVLNTDPNAIDDIVFAPSDPTIVYMATRGYLVYKSTDSGATFSLVKNVRDDVLNHDYCPDDDDKLEPGTCGCGTADTDTDNDGTADCNETDSNDTGDSDSGDGGESESGSSEEEVESFVTRFYNLCLDRPPDQTGLDGWVDNLMDGTQSGAEVARGFVFSSEFISQDTSNEDFLDILYSAFFNREPDAGGEAAWLAELESGTDRNEVLDGFIYASEFENLCWDYDIMPDQVAAFVNRFYELCLNRDPDFTGLMGWTHNLRNKVVTGADVARGFINSAEFINRNTTDQQYLTILYQAFFNRSADQAGWDSWIAQLESGTDRSDVLDGFIYAQEFIELCGTYNIDPF